VPRQETEKPAGGTSGGGLPLQSERVGTALGSPNSESPVASQVPPMSRGERDDLQHLLRRREKVLTSAAKQRSAELLADFENQLGTNGASIRTRFGRRRNWPLLWKSRRPTS
jgi:hypothetical protein